MWASAEVMTMVKMKKKAFKKFMKSRSENDYRTYASIRNKTKNVIRKAAVEFEKNIASQAKTDPKKFFKYVSSQVKTRPSIGDLRKKDGTYTETDEDRAELLNDYFSSVFTM